MKSLVGASLLLLVGCFADETCHLDGSCMPGEEHTALLQLPCDCRVNGRRSAGCCQEKSEQMQPARDAALTAEKAEVRKSGATSEVSRQLPGIPGVLGGLKDAVAGAVDKASSGASDLSGIAGNLARAAINKSADVVMGAASAATGIAQKAGLNITGPSKEQMDSITEAANQKVASGQQAMQGFSDTVIKDVGANVVSVMHDLNQTMTDAVKSGGEAAEKVFDTVAGELEATFGALPPNVPADLVEAIAGVVGKDGATEVTKKWAELSKDKSASPQSALAASSLLAVGLSWAAAALA